MKFANEEKQSFDTQFFTLMPPMPENKALNKKKKT